MYHIVIADDEKNAVNELLYLLDWESLDIIIDATAYDGEEALLLVEKYKPDILICDISMPKKMGTEVLREINNKKLDTLFIAISAYSDFEFAKTCINQGAIGYLLKTIDKNELLNIINKAKSIIASRNNYKDVTKYRRILMSLLEGSSSCLEDLNGLGLKQPFDYFTLIKCKSSSIPTLINSQNVSYACIPFSNSDETLVLINHDINEDILKLIPDNINLSGISSPSTHFERIYYEANCSYLSHQYFNLQKHIKYERTNPSSIVLAVTNIKKCTSVSEIDEIIKSSISNLNGLTALYNALIKDSDDVPISYSDFCNEFETLVDFEEFLLSFAANKSSDVKNKVIPSIYEYIQTHYRENISLASLSALFYISPDYMSHSFKNTYGISINKLIIDLRLNKAMELILEENDMTLMEISQYVGYSDYYYFNRLFKKHFNRTPSKCSDKDNL